jgi:hypothetical protein
MDRNTQPTPNRSDASEQWWRSQGYSGIVEYVKDNSLDKTFSDYFGLQVEDYIRCYPECANGLSLYEELTSFIHSPNASADVPNRDELELPPVKHLMTLHSRSVSVSVDEFEEALRIGVGKNDLEVGKGYIQVNSVGCRPYLWANDMRVVSIDREYFVGLNPGRHETSDFFFSTPMRSYGRDWILIECSTPLAQKLAHRTD